MPTPSTALDASLERHDDADWRRAAADLYWPEAMGAVSLLIPPRCCVFGRLVPKSASTFIGAP